MHRGGFDSPFLLAAIVFGFLIIPLAGAFQCPVGWPRTAMWVYAVAMAAVGLAAVALAFAGRSNVAAIDPGRLPGGPVAPDRAGRAALGRAIFFDATDGAAWTDSGLGGFLATRAEDRALAHANADRWPSPEVAANVNTAELGDLHLTPAEERAVVAFLRTLSDGYRP